MNSPITLPMWNVIVVCLWMIVGIASQTVDLWLIYLANKGANRKKSVTTTAMTGCAACNSWRSHGADYCATCGADLQNK